MHFEGQNGLLTFWLLFFSERWKNPRTGVKIPYTGRPAIMKLAGVTFPLISADLFRFCEVRQERYLCC